MTLAQKTDLINRIAAYQTPVTLDGKPALICGLCADFLTVVTRTSERLSHEYSWQAVARILDNGGAFKS